METAAFISKFHNLPEELKQKVLEFMDEMLAQLKQENTAEPISPSPKLPEELKDSITFLPHNDKLLPITPATEKPDIKSLVGIWKNNNRTLEQFRKEAWGRPLPPTK